MYLTRKTIQGGYVTRPEMLPSFVLRQQLSQSDRYRKEHVDVGSYEDSMKTKKA